MNINVTAIKGAYDAFNLNDGGWARSSIHPGLHDDAPGPRDAAAGGQCAWGEGARAISPRPGPVGIPDQLVVCGSPDASGGSSTSPHMHMEVAEFTM